MASSALFQAQNSPRSRHSRRSTAARGITLSSDNSSSPPNNLFSSGGIIDQEQIVASSSTPDSFLCKDATMGGFTYSAEDGADAQLENSDNGGGVKKPAWNKPSNDAIAEVVGAVMGADSWPALSESARASPKSSSSLKVLSLSHSPTSIVQEMAIASLPSPKEVSSGISSPNGNHVIPSRQMSMKRGDGSSSHSSMLGNDMPANDSLITHQAPPTQGAVVEVPPPKLEKSGDLVGEASRDNNRPGQRTSFRRNNSGPLFRGDGHNVGGRRDQERGKQDWNNSNRGFGNRERENHAPQQQRRAGSRPFIRGPAPNAAFVPPQPSSVAVRPFVTPMVYTEMPPPMPSPVFYVHGPHPDSLRPMPMVPISSMFFPMPDPYLHSKLVNQIDYYFSNENLVKDTFLRKNMDGEGWVLIKLIAGFKKVMELTDNIQLILHAIQTSNVVEVKGDKVRRKNDWFKWIMPHFESSVTNLKSINEPSQNMLAVHLNRVSLDGKAAT